jgi:alkylation response protein AidB-like acyl-CoA dehydrogenase
VDLSAVVLTAAQQAFAADLRALLDEYTDDDQRAARREQGDGFDEQLYLALGRKGWLWPRWPRADGGAELDEVCVRILETELLRREAPVNGGAARLVWPALEAFADPALSAELKPLVAGGQARFTLGYTEPEGGSDIAAARTLAVRDGDDWIINGRKFFSTSAQHANYTFLLTRTAPELPKHQGLTMFLVPLDSPGVQREALPTIGSVDNTIYYRDVRVPDRYRVGEVNNGWTVLRRPLDAEHHMNGQDSKLADVSGGIHHLRYVGQSVEAAVRWAREAPDGSGSPLIADPAFLADIGRLLVHAEAGAVTPGPMGRVKGSDVAVLGCEQLIDLVGPAAALPYGADGAVSDGIIAFAHRQAQLTALGGGAVEVFRTMIAQRDLGLPRPERPARPALCLFQHAASRNRDESTTGGHRS